ncbi:unnamed protein product, partial [Mesorhabditis spiculigera]
MGAASAGNGGATDWTSFYPNDWKLSQDLLVYYSRRLQKIEMWPYFDIPHYLFAALSVREDLGLQALPFARQHPFSCWLSTMMISFAGTFLANFLLGEAPIEPFKDHFDIIVATCAWYVIFYSPFDVVYKLTKFFPIKVVLSVLKEIQRAYKVSHGVAHARRLYPESYLVQAMVGISKGAGGGIVKTVEQLIRGVWTPHSHEILRPTFPTKACVIAATIFTIELNSNLITAPYDLVYLTVVGFFVYFKLSSLFLDVKDPLAPLENLFCAIFMGGIWDAFSRAVETTKDEVKATKKNKTNEDFLAESVTQQKNGTKKETKKTK